VDDEGGRVIAIVLEVKDRKNCSAIPYRISEVTWPNPAAFRD